jgi:Tfp pilus assembly protein PilO
MKFFKLKTLYSALGHLSKREKLVLYAAASFVSLALLDRLIIYPIANKLQTLDNEIREKESGIRRNMRILAQKDRIRTESAKYSTLLNSLKYSEEGITALLKEIEGLASKSEVYLIDMKPAGLKSAGPYKKYLINLNCEAQMEQIVDFMYNIESSKRLLSIDKYQIGPKSESSSVAKCSMSISKVVTP